MRHDVMVSFSELIVSLFYTAIFSDGTITGDAIDAGANHGVHSRPLGLLLAPSGRRVLAIEPNATLIPHIVESCRGEMLTNVLVENAALVTGDVEFVEFENVLSDSQLSRIRSEGFLGVAPPELAGHATAIERVAAISLPRACAKWRLDPVFIKMDIEQAEYPILMNEVEFIASKRAFLSIEIGSWSVPEGGMGKLFDLYHERGYVFVDGTGAVYSRERFGEREQYWNRFMVPREREEVVRRFRSLAAPLWAAVEGRTPQFGSERLDQIRRSLEQAGARMTERGTKPHGEIFGARGSTGSVARAVLNEIFRPILRKKMFKKEKKISQELLALLLRRAERRNRSGR